MSRGTGMGGPWARANKCGQGHRCVPTVGMDKGLSPTVSVLWLWSRPWLGPLKEIGEHDCGHERGVAYYSCCICFSGSWPLGVGLGYLEVRCCTTMGHLFFNSVHLVRSR